MTLRGVVSGLLLACSVAFLACGPERADATVPVGAASRNDYTAAGESSFAFTFVAISSSWVQVQVGGVVQSSGYSVSLNADQTTSPGGSILFSVAPATGATIRIQRQVPIGQDLNLSSGRTYSSAALNQEFDRLTYVDQQLARSVADIESAGGIVGPQGPAGAAGATGATGATGPAGDGFTYVYFNTILSSLTTSSWITLLSIPVDAAGQYIVEGSFNLKVDAGGVPVIAATSLPTYAGGWSMVYPSSSSTMAYAAANGTAETSLSGFSSSEFHTQFRAMYWFTPSGTLTLAARTNSNSYGLYLMAPGYVRYRKVN